MPERIGSPNAPDRLASHAHDPAGGARDEPRARCCDETVHELVEGLALDQQWDRVTLIDAGRFGGPTGRSHAC